MAGVKTGASSRLWTCGFSWPSMHFTGIVFGAKRFWHMSLHSEDRHIYYTKYPRGRGWGGATSQLPQPQNKLTSPAGSLLMGPHGGGRQMEWTLSPEPGVPAPSCPGIGAPMEPRVNTDCDATFQEEGLLSSCQETL